jgi:hypothetical protein
MDSPGVNCVDRHKENMIGSIGRVALIWEKVEPAGQEVRVAYYNIMTNSSRLE